MNWAIRTLGVEEEWERKMSPLELVRKGTGQRILFRGCDDPRKLKSVKFQKGYAKFIWYEEADELNGMAEIRSMNQSLMRGGEEFRVFYSYNPPKFARSWVNQETAEQRSDRLVHHSTYLGMRKEWLGSQFLAEAEYIRKRHPEVYRHEYLGEVTGGGGEVFCNLTLRKIPEGTMNMEQRTDMIGMGLGNKGRQEVLNHSELMVQILCCAFSYLISAGNMLEGLSPFGVALVAACPQKLLIACSIGAAGGSLFPAGVALSMKYAAGVMIAAVARMMLFGK